MEEDLLSADDFFGDVDKRAWSPLVRVSDRRVNQKGRDAFEDLKVRMVMKLEGCSKEEAGRIIAARREELRAKENKRRNAQDLDFTK